ncbi:hypothetical protein K1719_014681 [Acacia pycnantha]|nr:hypothetical protein K1719_014681 [Acacia pycnantha]
MLSHTQELVGNRHVPSSTQSRRGSGGDREFSFWCSSSKTESSTNDCVRLLGRSGEGTGFKSKHSTLMPSSHHCYSVSHNSRSQAIAESRKELMQMLQDLPESAFELSFQYMVQQQQQALQPVQNEAYIDEKIKNSVNEAQVTKQDTKEKEKEKAKEKKKNKPNQILRVESMDNENFLLKMFFPSLKWKKAAKVGNVPKLSPAPSFNNYVKQIGKQQRIKSSQTGDNRSDLKDHTDESTNNCRKRCGKRRYADGNFSLGCWPFSMFSQKQRNREDQDEI